MANENVIGKSNDLPWYLPADLKHFKQLTLKKTVLMGRKTADSILARLSHGLPNRKNVVLTRDMSYKPEGMEIVHSLNDVLVDTDTELMIIGGAQLYEQTINRADRLYVTEVHADIHGDTFFPKIDSMIWTEVAREKHTSDDSNQYDYDFVTLNRTV